MLRVMPLGPLLGILFALAFVGGIVWVLVYAVRKGREQVTAPGTAHPELAKLLGTPPDRPLYGKHDVVMGDRTVSIHLVAGGKNTPPMLRVVLPIDIHTVGAKAEQGVYRDTARRRVHGQLAVTFRKERPIDGFGKRIGLNVEHETGDSAFDSEVYIESDAATADLEALLADTASRQAVHQILGLGYLRVELFRGTPAVSAMLQSPSGPNVATIPQLAERLAVIADNLPAFDGSPVGRAVPLRAAIASIVGVLGGFGAFVFAALGATHWRVIAPGAMVECGLLGLAGWLAVSVVAFFLLRGKSDALRTFSVVLFSGLFGLPALGVGTGATLNGKLDTAPPTAHDARITKRYTTTSKNNTTYHLEVESWRPDTTSIEVTVPPPVYGPTNVGGLIRIQTRPGWLGWEWVTAVQPAPPASSP